MNCPLYVRSTVFDKNKNWKSLFEIEIFSILCFHLFIKYLTKGENLRIIAENFAVDSVFSPNLTFYGHHRDHPPAWELKK